MSSSKSMTYTALTLTEKVAVIREVEKKKSEIAKDFGIPTKILIESNGTNVPTFYCQFSVLVLLSRPVVL